MKKVFDLFKAITSENKNFVDHFVDTAVENEQTLYGEVCDWIRDYHHELTLLERDALAHMLLGDLIVRHPDGVVRKTPMVVWVFTAEQAADDDVFDVVTEVFSIEEDAKKYLFEFVHGKEGEKEFAEKRGWTIEYDEDDHFRAFEKGYYDGNHTEVQIVRREVR